MLGRVGRQLGHRLEEHERPAVDVNPARREPRFREPATYGLGRVEQRRMHGAEPHLPAVVGPLDRCVEPGEMFGEPHSVALVRRLQANCRIAHVTPNWSLGARRRDERGSGQVPRKEPGACATTRRGVASGLIVAAIPGNRRPPGLAHQNARARVRSLRSKLHLSLAAGSGPTPPDSTASARPQLRDGSG